MFNYRAHLYTAFSIQVLKCRGGTGGIICTTDRQIRNASVDLQSRRGDAPLEQANEAVSRTPWYYAISTLPCHRYSPSVYNKWVLRVSQRDRVEDRKRPPFSWDGVSITNPHLLLLFISGSTILNFLFFFFFFIETEFGVRSGRQQPNGRFPCAIDWRSRRDPASL